MQQTTVRLPVSVVAFTICTSHLASALAPVVVIPHAHCDVKPRGKMAKSVSDFQTIIANLTVPLKRSSVKTVTSVLYLPQNSQQLISSGSFDG